MFRIAVFFMLTLSSFSLLAEEGADTPLAESNEGTKRPRSKSAKSKSADSDLVESTDETQTDQSQTDQQESKEPQAKSSDAVKPKKKRTKSKAKAAETLGLIPIMPDEQTATLEYIPLPSSKPKASQAKRWLEFCDRFGKMLTEPTTLKGFLSSFVCEPVGGTASPLLWRIQIIEKEGSFDVETSYNSGNEFVKVSSLSFASQGNIFKAFKGEEVPTIISRMLMESLPTGWKFETKAKMRKFAFKTYKKYPPLPDELVIFDLSYDLEKKTWNPQIRAQLKRVSTEEDKDKMRIERFEVSEILLPLEREHAYWVQNAAGVNKRQKLYEEHLSESSNSLSILNTLDSLFRDSLTSNYAGFRYGIPMIKGDSILTEINLLSILMEFRSGPLAGLRWYYDVFPYVEKGKDDTQEYFGLKRALIGWSFAFEAPEKLRPFITTFDLQPKIGLLDLRSRVSVLASVGTTSLSFDAKNVYDLALELGAEKETPWFRARLWGSYSAAKFGLSNKTAVSVVSGRAGADATFDMFKWGASGKVDILTFALAERLSISKDPKSLSEAEIVNLSAVTFRLFYLGVGFTVSW